MKVTLAEVEAYGAKWIPRLHLLDWQIHFEITDCEDAAGTCKSDWLKMITWIKIDERMPDHMFRDFWFGVGEGRKTEWVVVHELLHVKEEPQWDRIGALTKDDEILYDALVAFRERQIDQTVRVLLEADASGAWGLQP